MEAGINKYRLLKMNSRGGRYYAEEIATGLRKSLKTADPQAAQKLLHALNEAHRNPHLNQLMGQTYLAGRDPQAMTRTWETPSLPSSLPRATREVNSIAG